MTRGILRGGAACWVALVTCGCVTPSTYSTPRTVGKGDFVLTAAFEATDVTTEDPNVDPEDRDEFLPLLPTVIFRLGMAERTDIGLAARNLSSFGLDLKHLFVQGVFDAAVDPGFQLVGYPIDSTDDLYFLSGHFPLLLGLNLSHAFSIVGAAGVTLTASYFGDSPEEAFILTGAASNEVVMGRGSLGFDWRVTQTVAIHPEVTVLRGFEHDTTGVIGGIGVSVGRLPSFIDVE